MEGKLLTAQEVADILKIKKNTVYELVKRGEIPSKKVGKQVRISEQDIQQYLNLSEQPTVPYVPQAIVQAAPAQAESRDPESDQLILCGQDVSLDMIANYFSAKPGMPRILRSYAGSYNSLYALYQGEADIATAHLWDETAKEYNYTFIKKLVPGVPVIAIRLFGRMQGFYVQKGNPKNIKGWEDFQREDLRFINREKGSGTRVLLDEKLKSMHITAGEFPGYYDELTSHLSVASAVARGDADFGLGSENARLQIGNVDFIPLQPEWYDMVFLEHQENTKVYRAILDYICSEYFLRELAAIGSYDISQTGKIVRL